jgi:hypothetical protein
MKKKWVLTTTVMLALLAAPWILGLAPAAAGQPCDPQSACFDVSLAIPGLVGDFYVDGHLAFAGVSQARIVGTPDSPHVIEVKNIQEPAAPGNGDLFNYGDQSVTQQTHAGWIWRVLFYPVRNYLKGTLTYVCNPRGSSASSNVACHPSIDGNSMPTVAPGASASYFLTPGTHAVHSDLEGGQAGNWSQTARDDSVTIDAARISWLVAAYDLKALLKLNVYPTGVLADLYVDGTLIASRVTAQDVYVTPRVLHVVEAKNVSDPAANNLYRYNDASQRAYVYPGGTGYVGLRPVKVWLTGGLSVSCLLYGKTPTDDAECAVTVDGTPAGAVAAGASALFTLPIGSHTIGISVAGASASNWAGALSVPVTTYGGGRTYYFARFSRNRAAAPAAAPASAAPAMVLTAGFELGGQVADFTQADQMKYAGMTWVKRQVRWSPGATPDAAVIGDAHARGFKILLSVLGNPSDISGGSNFDSYAAFVGGLAGQGADAIEVWNEMNIDREWPAGQINPAMYTDLLRRAYAQIKGRNPNTLVISGALAPTGAEGAFGRDHVWNDNNYLAGMAAAGAGGAMDCLGVHYNEGILSPLQNSGDPRDPYYTRYYNGMVSTYYNAFGGAKKLCFTELGYLSPEGYGALPASFGWAGNTTAAEQALWLGQAAQLAQSSRLVRLMIVFNVDFTYYGADPQAGYAIVRPGGGCPACATLRGVMGAH